MQEISSPLQEDLGGFWVTPRADWDYFTDTTALTVDSVLGVLSVQGRQLELGGRVLVRRGDRLEKVLERLGHPDKTRGLLGWCQEDPVVLWLYRREGVTICVTVSNDDFLESHHAKDGYDCVWAVRIQHPQLSKLYQERLQKVIRMRLLPIQHSEKGRKGAGP